MVTTHHCPGLNKRIGPASPGGCEKRGTNPLHCKKHQKVCKHNKPHLITEHGCGKCMGALHAAEREHRQARLASKETKKDRIDEFLGK
jgi:hypothetical protein